MKTEVINLLNNNKFYEALEKYHKNRIKDFTISDQIQVLQIIDSAIHDSNQLNKMIKKLCEMLQISYIIKDNKIIKYYDNT
jgi:hypothetical protein